jgi:hypothetical protein
MTLIFVSKLKKKRHESHDNNSKHSFSTLLINHIDGSYLKSQGVKETLTPWFNMVDFVISANDMML